MKKTSAILLALLCFISLCGCSRISPDNAHYAKSLPQDGIDELLFATGDIPGFISAGTFTKEFIDSEKEGTTVYPFGKDEKDFLFGKENTELVQAYTYQKTITWVQNLNQSQTGYPEVYIDRYCSADGKITVDINAETKTLLFMSRGFGNVTGKKLAHSELSDIANEFLEKISLDLQKNGYKMIDVSADGWLGSVSYERKIKGYAEARKIRVYITEDGLIWGLNAYSYRLFADAESNFSASDLKNAEACLRQRLTEEALNDLEIKRFEIERASNGDVYLGAFFTFEAEYGQASGFLYCRVCEQTQ